MRSKSLSVILLLLSLAEARAEDGVGLAPAVAAIFPRGEEVCYLAGPETTGLKAGQKLSEFYLYKLYRPLHAREEMGPSPEDAIARERKLNSSSASLDVVARFRDSPNVYSQSVLCTTHDGGKTISCGVECDGGSFAVDPGNRTLEITVPADGSGLSLNQSCGDPDDEGRERWLTAADAGGSFTLERWPMAHCIAAAEDAHPAFAEDPMPLRERVAVSGWRCLKRVYDAAHLKAHPEQEVVAMSVAIKGPGHGRTRMTTAGSRRRSTSPCRSGCAMARRIAAMSAASPMATSSAAATTSACGGVTASRPGRWREAMMIPRIPASGCWA